MTEQLDLLDMLAADTRVYAERVHGVPSLFTLRRDSLADYDAAFTDWQHEWGSHDSYRQSHAWHPTIRDQFSGDLDPTPTCHAGMLLADLRCGHHTPCSCVGDLLYRGLCRGCGWHSPITDTENDAVLATLDHAHPGWRENPIVPAPPPDPGPGNRRHHAWIATVTELHGGPQPTGWPIITRRGPSGHRAVPGRSPWSGYDVAAETLHR